MCHLKSEWHIIQYDIDYCSFNSVVKSCFVIFWTHDSRNWTTFQFRQTENWFISQSLLLLHSDWFREKFYLQIMFRLSYKPGMYSTEIIGVHRYGVVCRVPDFQPGGPGSIPDGVRDFNFYPGTRFVSSVCALSCGVSGGGHDFLLPSDSGRSALLLLSSILVHSFAHLTGF